MYINMIKCYYKNERDIKIRLNKIDGQLNGIYKMIEDGRECIEILNQISSIRAALKGVSKEIIKNHLNICITDAIKNGNTGKELIEELVDNISKVD